MNNAAPKDVLLRLARCSELSLFLIVCGCRMIVLLAMLFCRAVLPKLIGTDLLLDSGGLLYEDTSREWSVLDYPRNWDAVHYFHVAKNGYSHENNCVFFPLVPFMVQAMSWLNTNVLPASLAAVPVSFQLSLLNVLLGGAAGIFLRRTTVLTLLGPAPMKKDTVALGGTWLDELPPPPPPRWVAKEKARDIDNTQTLWREVGGAMLMWIMNPTVVFTVVVYTEGVFSFLTFLGVYLLVLPTSAKGGNSAVGALTEAGAVACFTLAGFARSNAFLYIGYLLYPIVLQLFFFSTYRRRYARFYGTAELPGRWPSAARCTVTVLEVLIIMSPYVFMNFFCFSRFVPLWDAASRKAIGNHFWHFYGWMQKRYWNVGFLSSYTLKNAPNVVIASPILFFTMRSILLFYLHPTRAKMTTASSPVGAADVKGSNSKKGNNTHTQLRSLHKSLEGIVQSSNTVCLLLLILIGVSVVHVNVVNRFIMSSPALYWYWSRQIVNDPWGGYTVVMLRIFVIWMGIGVLFFPNGMPWT
ncbi:putative mannosyltransferase-II [Trypanosoma grayi]|uniref:putative mannosyltransferase-II n=1 Tax=Trypanosoma grayi TaxID=71804 RepID=UPI0004F408D9|nr:putative mannosyltransferase-II [Trypanosoma grayi]KEG13303.1 putative mannosyltransferase-II [Trypanosoma grayi]